MTRRGVQNGPEEDGAASEVVVAPELVDGVAAELVEAYVRCGGVVPDGGKPASQLMLEAGDRSFGVDLNVLLRRISAFMQREDIGDEDREQGRMALEAELKEHVRQRLATLRAGQLPSDGGPNPVVEALRRLYRREKESKEAWEVVWDAVVDYYRGLTGRTLMAVPTVAVVVGAAWWFSAELHGCHSQWRADVASGREMGARVRGTAPLGFGMTLDGATVRFPCIPTHVALKKKIDVPNGSTPQVLDLWLPGPIEEDWDHDSLEEDFFGVDFDGVDPRSIDIAESGWGITVSFSEHQAGIAESVGGKLVEVRGYGPAYVLPTATFMPDVHGIADRAFTIGQIAEDGLPVQYYLINLNSLDANENPLVCDGEVKIDDAEPEMLTATLMRELPERTLEDFLPEGMESLTMLPAYQEAFEEFGLGKWYEGIYPALVSFLDLAVRNASRKAVDHEEIKVLVDYFVEHEFEQDLLRTLTYLERNANGDTFAAVVKNIKSSEMPALNQTEERLLSKMHASGLSASTGAPGGNVMLTSQFLTKETIYHELIHAIVQGSPSKKGLWWRLMCWAGKRESFDAGQDRILTEGMTEFLTHVGRGLITDAHTVHPCAPCRSGYYGRVTLVQQLIQNGHLNDLLKFYMLEPEAKLTGTQKSILDVMGVPHPSTAFSEHMYSVLFRDLGLNSRSSTEEVTAVVPLFYVFVAFDKRALGELGYMEEHNLEADLVQVSMLLAEDEE